MNSVRDAQVDVRFEQRFANFAERHVQVLFGELALATQVLEGSLQPICECFKHGLRPRPRQSRPRGCSF